MDLQTLGQTYGTWGAIIIFVIYLVYQLIKDSISNKREKIKKASEIEFQTQLSEQMLENSEVNKELLRYLKTISQEYADVVTEPQARILSEYIFESSKYYLFDEMRKIINENHILGNEREISAKIRQIVQNRYHKDSMSLKEYKLKDKTLSNFLKEVWKEDVTSNVTEIILAEKGEKVLKSYLSNIFDGYRCEFQDSFF